MVALLGPACTDGDGGPAVATTTPAEGAWDPAAVDRLRGPAETLASSEVGCAGFAPHPYEPYRASFDQAGLPTPAASAGCTTADDEDLTFEAFPSPGDKEAFLAAKADLLCARGREIDPEGFPGLPYVDGGDWIIEPDTDATAGRAARVLGLPSGNACGTEGTRDT